MKTYAFDFTKNCIYSHPTLRDAQAHGNGRTLAANEEALIEARVTMDQMVSLYNALTPSAPVKKFETKGHGAKRLIVLAAAKAIEVKFQQEKEPMTATETAAKTAKPKKEKVAKEPSEKKGRQSTFAGKKIFLADGVTENPRREGTGGFKSMEIIIANACDGITYEDFIAAGGRRQDLVWDLDKGSVILE